MGVEQGLLALIGAADVGGYEIEQSLRFDGSSRLDFGSPTSQTVSALTVSCWVKVCMSNSYGATILDRYSSPNTATRAWLIYNAFGTNQFDSYYYTSSINGRGLLSSQGRHRDPSAWQHVVFSFDNTAGQYSQKIFINGVDRTNNFSEATNGVVGFEFSSTYPLTIGWNSGEMYLAEYHLISGSQVNYDQFGEFDNNGVWRPIEYTGSYGTNGFYLKFDPSATNGIGHDHSGNGNNLTANGFTTSGTGTDVMSDTPTTNWSTLNPLWNPIQATYAEGNLKFTGGSEHSPSASSISASSGKFYFEATALSGSQAKWSLGIIDTDIPYRKQTSAINYIPGYTPNNVYSAGDAISLYDNNIYKNGSIVVSSPFSGGAVAAGNVVQMAVDIDAGKIWFGINGTWNNGGGTEGAFNPSGHDTTFTANKDYIFHFTAESCGWEVNFGQRAFAYTPPTGFKALNTSNLPAPGIKDGSDYFNAVAYAGNSSTQSINVGFQPDFLWLKSRTQGYSHWLVDSIRGTHAKLSSDSTALENTDTTKNPIEQFTSTGFDLQYTADDGLTYSDVNASGQNFIAWNWLAGNGTSSIAAGSIDGTNPTIASTVSVNATAGFSIVSYSGSKTSAGSDTVGHGLGVAPSLIIVKRRNSAYGWSVAHASLGFGSSNILALDSTAAAGAYSWDDFGAAPTSSVFTVSYSNRTNISGGTHIAYCFAEVEGYSKFGSYTGNGSFVDVNGGSDGPFVYCGFEPQWVMIRQSNTTNNWIITDNKRDTTNPTTGWLYADDPYFEESNNGRFLDFLSNGFKIRSPGSGFNTSGGTYLFVAFAENPFGGSGVSPATAR